MKQTSYTEVVKRVRSKVLFWKLLTRNRWRAAKLRRSIRSRKGTSLTIVAFPERPHPASVLFMIGARLGARFSRRAPEGSNCLSIWWEDATYRKQLPSHLSSPSIVNARCLDISKSAVSRAYDECFPQQLSIDPTLHRGPALEKPELNASHVGRVVDCPMIPRAGACYQLIVDNEVEGGMVEDLRVVFMDGRIPVVYRKLRTVEDRYSNTNVTATLVTVDDVISPDEMLCLRKMAEMLGIDYGEFDCLRHRGDGALYVVDANSTPWGPPNHLPAWEAEEALKRMTAEFYNSFIKARGIGES